MQIISATKTAKETILNRKKNLFGLGLTSLIAACGTDKAAGDDTQKMPDDNDNEMPDNGIDTYTPTVDLPDEAERAADLTGTGDGKSGFTATPGGVSPFPVTIIGNNVNATLTFSDGNTNSNNAAKIYKLTTTAGQYDLVVSSPTIDGSKGGAFIFWNVAGIQDETIGGTSTSTINQRLEIKGPAADDSVGSFAPELLQIGGTVNNYDMVLAGVGVNNASDVSGAGAIYVLWDVADYAGATKTIDLGKLDEVDPLTGDLGLGATSGSLAIYGAKPGDNIGNHAPEFLQLGGVADDKVDMVIRSHAVDKPVAGGNGLTSKGAIYVLWDITGYYDAEVLNKAVVLDNSLIDASGAYTNGATYGLLAIYGAKRTDYIGIHAPQLLELGSADNAYDMVIRSHAVDKPVAGGNDLTSTGAIYVLWDVADYAGKNKVIDLDPAKLAEADTATSFGEGATSGSLTIYGANAGDAIGKDAPEFLQIAGKADNYDMVIGAGNVDKPVEGDNPVGNTGAIYVLWDVADYTGQNKTIDFATPADATSGLLTIYGRAGAGLGSDDNNILYGSDSDGSKSLTNIDNDAAGTIDIALTDDKYTYIFFGDKVANDANGDDKVDSKTIDLAKIETELGADMGGFFGYNFDSRLGTATTPASTEDRVGYRFADNAHTTLQDVQGAYTTANPSGLSDTDADLGVWDIA